VSFWCFWLECDFGGSELSVGGVSIKSLLAIRNSSQVLREGGDHWLKFLSVHVLASRICVCVDVHGFVSRIRVSVQNYHRSIPSTILREGGDRQLKLPNINSCKKVDLKSIAGLGIESCKMMQTNGRNKDFPNCQKLLSVTLGATSYEEVAQVSRDELSSRSRVCRTRESNQWLIGLGSRSRVCRTRESNQWLTNPWCETLGVTSYEEVTQVSRDKLCIKNEEMHKMSGKSARSKVGVCANSSKDRRRQGHGQPMCFCVRSRVFEDPKDPIQEEGRRQGHSMIS
jgi:hypothetical protein